MNPPPLPLSRSPTLVREQWQINKFLWICLLFLAIFVPLARKHEWITISLPVAYAILSAAILNASVRTYSAWRSGGSNGPIGWLFTGIDIGLISIGVRVSGELRSEVWLAYFVVMIAESLYATRLQTNCLLLGIIAAYLWATWPAHTEYDYFLTVATRLFFLLILGFFARRMSANRDKESREVLRLSEQVAASDERARIAREIHDGLGHALVASILRLELCRRLVRKSPAEAEEILLEEVPALRSAWNEGRNLAFHLRPWERDEAGFAESLRRHLSRFAERTGLTLDLRIEDGISNLATESELALTRIVQEALTNVARHAKASRIEVALSRNGRRIHCVISDDGVGFEPSEQNAGFGLYAMRERAEKLGGTLEIKSENDSGTVIEVLIPG